MTAIGLCDGPRRRVVLANMTDQPQTVDIDVDGSRWTLRTLDAHNVEQALRHPFDFRAQSGAHLSTTVGRLTITIDRWALAQLDAIN